MPLDVAAQLEALWEAPIGLALFDLELRYVRVNSALAAIDGVPAPAHVGRTVLEVLPDQDPEVVEQLRRVRDTGCPLDLEVAGRTPRDPSALHHWRVTCFPVREGTAVCGIGASVVDITERRRAERAAQGERDFIAAVLDTTANLILVLDRQGTIVRFNKACERVTGYTAAEVVGRPVFETLIPQPELTDVREVFRRLRRGDFPNAHRNRWRLKDGTHRLIEWANTCIADERGEVEFVIATGTDVTDRDSADAALRRREEEARAHAAELQAILGCIADGVVVYDRGGRITRTNAAADATLPHDPWMRQRPMGERLAQAWPQWLTEDGHPLAAEEAAPTRAMTSGAPVKGTVLRMRTPDEERWFHVSAAPLVGQGRVEGAVVSMSDITRLRRAEQAVRTAEQRLRSVIEELPSGLIVADLETRDLQWNAEALAIHGYARDGDVHRFLESLIADHDLRTLGGDPIPVEEWPLPRLFAGQPFRDYEILVRNVRLGWERVFSYSSVVIPGEEGGGRVGLLAIQDVTDRRRAVEALRRSEEEARAQTAQLEAILNCVGDGVIVYDTSGRTLRSTPAADELVGLDARARAAPVHERVMEQYQFLTEDGRALTRDEVPAVRAVLHGEAVPPMVLRVMNARTDRWLRLRTTPFFLDARHVGAVLSMTDVTDRKRAEQELQALNERLREADRRKDEFLGMLSHELRNPLAPVRNSLYILGRPDATADQARRATQVANRQIAHMTRLVDDLLDVTRIARGKIQLRRAALDLGTLVRRAAEDHRALMHDRRLALDVEAPAGPVTVHGDETRLAQVLGNLLHNAAKFTPAGGRVTLALAVEGGSALLRVRDTGTGIEPAMLATVFEPFMQARQTLARSEGGLGLGLALVKGLVAMHGGEVIARSGGLGRGTEFEVRLPVARPAADHRRSVNEDAVAAPMVHRHVLVVDDNKDAAESLAELLALSGHEVAVAHDGPSALALAAARRPDVVLCDIGLPGMDGYEVARRLRRSEARGARLVAVSGYAQPEDVARATEAGFDAHVAKPPDPAQIVALLG